MPTPATGFAALLEQAVTEPGLVATAYRQFHTYSLGNQLLALGQCLSRGLTPGPLATYPRWRALGRQVRKGEKAITLCLPITVKRKSADARETEETAVFTRFIHKPHWFVLSQTDGPDLPPIPVPEWDASRALTVLGVQEIPFDLTDGNILGFARRRQIAVSPLSPLPHKTRFHELAHVLLGHTQEADQTDERSGD